MGESHGNTAGEPPAHEGDVDRFRALGVELRELGILERVTELSVGSIHVKLAAQRQTAPAPTVRDADEQRELDAEEAAEAQMSHEERQHRKYWRRVVRSSGAPIPPFKPVVRPQ